MSESKRLTLLELEATTEYQKLTHKQQLFVATYCAGGLADGHYDAVQATVVAYKCATREIARIMSYSLMANIRIVAAVNRHFNAEPISRFLEELDRAVRNKKLTMAQLGALKLKCDLLGLKTLIPDDHNTIGSKIEAVEEGEKKKRKASRQEKALAQPAEPSAVPDPLKGFFS